MNERADCLCTWAAYGLGGTTLFRMTVRHHDCLKHGDGTDWWAEQDRIARALGASIIAADPGWTA